MKNYIGYDTSITAKKVKIAAIKDFKENNSSKTDITKKSEKENIRKELNLYINKCLKAFSFE